MHDVPAAAGAVLCLSGDGIGGVTAACVCAARCHRGVRLRTGGEAHGTNARSTRTSGAHRYGDHPRSRLAHATAVRESAPPRAPEGDVLDARNARRRGGVSESPRTASAA